MYVTSRKNMSANEEMELMKELKTLASKDNADNNQAAVKEVAKFKKRFGTRMDMDKLRGGHTNN